MRDNPLNTTTLTRDTIAFNSATSTAGGGLYIADTEPFNVAGWIVSNNTGNISQVAVVIGPSNCGGPAKPTSNGSNVESLADCNFTTTADRRTRTRS